MAVILFAGDMVSTFTPRPQSHFAAGASHVILRIVTNHRNDRAVRSAGTRPVRAVKAGGSHIKVLMLHCFPSMISFTNCTQHSG